MDKMEVDEEVVDLSVGSRRIHEPPPPPTTTMTPINLNANCGSGWPSRRSLRPRTEHRSYVESPDIVIVSDDEPKTNGFTNGNIESDDDDIEMPVFPPIKELTPNELAEREKLVKKCRDELRNEEMTLVLLKKLRQSQQMKENIGVVPPINTVPTPSTHSMGPAKTIPPRTSSKPVPQPNVQQLLRGQPSLFSRGAPNVHVPPPVIPNRPVNSGLPLQTSISRNNSGNVVPPRNVVSYSTDRKDSRHSPLPVAVGSQADRRTVEDSQTPAQRQAAAKLALRKQLEKTLLQIPPPKPPPPEMHFIPNPSNTEFIYLVGLEHVVDYITKDSRSPPPPEPFRCSQCSTNFTPVWKWEKGSNKGKEPKVICEHCVTTNVKKALKAEHTNRLKTAFVKALQQEQEIEQRLAHGSPQPEPMSPMSLGSLGSGPTSAQPLPKPATPKPAPVPSPNRENLAKLSDSSKFGGSHGVSGGSHGVSAVSAASAAVLHQQLLRAGLPQHHQPMPAHMMPFSPLLYPYQLAMAQAASGKGSVAAAAANLVELQRQAADLQRQYMMM